MLKSCAYCGRLHDTAYDCGQKSQRRKDSTEITKLRTCRRWDRTRKAVLQRDHGLCRVCFAGQIICAEGLEVHHITPLSEDPSTAYDPANLITLCVAHHKAADAGQLKREVLRHLAASEMTLHTPPEGAEMVISGSRIPRPHETR